MLGFTEIKTQENVRELLHYNEKTGIFTLRKRPYDRYPLQIGDTVGFESSNNTLSIQYNKKRYMLHKLAFLYMSGYMPSIINHINGDNTDNRWVNLVDNKFKEKKIIKRNWKESSYKYLKSEKGLVTKLYTQQKVSSKNRGHNPPQYSKEEFRAWMVSQDNFQELLTTWKKSGYKTTLVPSVDRIDDYKPYTFCNIRLVTWKENCDKACRDRRNGVNNKRSKSVLQFSKDGKFINEFWSMREAERQTGVKSHTISDFCSGKVKKVGDFIWRLNDSI